MAWLAVKLVLEKVPFFALALLFALFGLLAQKKWAMHMVADHGLVSRLMQAAYGLCFYPWKTIAPVRLSPLYLFPPDFNPLAARYVACAALALGVTAWLTARRRRRPWALTAWLCYAVIVSPVLGLAQSGRQIAADRYTYLACLPFAVLVAAGLLRLRLARQGGRITRSCWAAVVTGAIAILIAFGAQTLRQTRVWRDGFTLWEHALGIDPEHFIAYNNRGLGRQARGDIAGAMEDYEAAIRVNPEYPDGYLNRGVLRRMLNDEAGALEDYNAAIRVKPTLTAAYYNRANLRRDRGDADGALEDFSTVIRLRPEHAFARNNRGNLRKARGDLDGALEDYNVAIATNPELAPAYNNRGAIRHQRQDVAGALADYSAALRLDPKALDARHNRGVLRRSQGDLAGAVADFAKLLGLAPPNWPHRARVTRLLARTRKALAAQGR